MLYVSKSQCLYITPNQVPEIATHRNLHDFSEGLPSSPLQEKEFTIMYKLGLSLSSNTHARL